MKFKVVQLGLAVMMVLILTACSTDVNGVPSPRPESKQSVATGRQLIASYGCGSCHSIPGIPGADSKAAPPLDHFYQRSYIAGTLPNTEDNQVKWIQNPQQVIPGNAMPDLGVSAAEARSIAAYLYHQPGLTDLLSR